MNSYSEWLLKIEEHMPVMKKWLLYVYVNKMGIGWAISFFLLLVFSCYAIRDIMLSYIFEVTGGVVGVVLCILRVFSMTADVKTEKSVKMVFSLHPDKQIHL